jgi:hypothetical protein
LVKAECEKRTNCASTPTPTPAVPTITTNKPPVITTESLPDATVSVPYYFYIYAKDENLGDNLTMQISNLPVGLKRGPCGVPFSGGEISCQIYGSPTVSASAHEIIVSVEDHVNPAVTKKLTLIIKPIEKPPASTKNFLPAWINNLMGR